MRKTLALIGFALLVSCAEAPKKKILVEGDLYFKVTAFHNFHGKSEAERKELESYITEISAKNNPAKEEKELLSYYNKLRDHELLDAPFINIKEKNGEIRQIFLDAKEYPKVSRYNLSNLITRHKKLVLQLEASEVEKDVFYSEKILSVKETDGKIPWEQ